MCLGIPMQVVEIENTNARCNARGVERTVSLFMLTDQTVSVGDYVLVHVGYAIQKVAEQDALSTWDLLDQMSAAESADA